MSSATSDTARFSFDGERMIIGHRGLSSLAPENTMAAFRAAVDHHLAWVEADVDVIADGTVIICHDSTLDRTTDRTGRYDALTVADLSGIDAGSWFSPRFNGEPLPTLARLIDLMNETGLNANIEIKPNETGREATLRLIDGVVAQLERLRPGVEVIVSSFSHVLLHLFKQRAPKVPVGCLYEKHTLSGDWRSTLEIVGADYIHPEDSSLTREQVQAFRAEGYGVNVWTVNSLSRANELFNWGVTGVFSDIAHHIPRR
ncbi:glycerophosphoryl diester phosphodiesterase [Actinomyces sp. ZJ308]|uniref:glycerophosphoryl diester phosphodiesterase n=1 Tax=Actinomyces sp. ZJ308 TaxID=2708342 RepID=UPI0014239E99|nr:glycerophosphoryl diester phosphodiesterase [Actinomyces sp. ZJ308]